MTTASPPISIPGPGNSESAFATAASALPPLLRNRLARLVATSGLVAAGSRPSARIRPRALEPDPWPRQQKARGAQPRDLPRELQLARQRLPPGALHAPGTRLPATPRRVVGSRPARFYTRPRSGYYVPVAFAVLRSFRPIDQHAPFLGAPRRSAVLPIGELWLGVGLHSRGERAGPGAPAAPSGEHLPSRSSTTTERTFARLAGHCENHTDDTQSRIWCLWGPGSLGPAARDRVVPHPRTATVGRILGQTSGFSRWICEWST